MVIAAKTMEGTMVGGITSTCASIPLQPLPLVEATCIDIYATKCSTNIYTSNFIHLFYLVSTSSIEVGGSKMVRTRN